MATVYLARDVRHQRLVALKVLRPEVTGMVGSGRFAREIAIASRLHHPHILPIYESGTLPASDGTSMLFYTMPFVAGQSVRDRLRERPQLPVAEAVGIARQVAEALDYAHGAGVVHRDIKPENILLGQDGAMVADFGIARVADAAGERLTQTGMALGTPAYMSPEQAAGSSRLDGRTDIYSLGCVLYEMLVGEPPFTGPSAQAILARHAADPVPSIRTVRPEIGPDLPRAVRRALAKVRADRYPTAGAFADALKGADTGWSGGSAVTASPGGYLRRPRVLAVGGVLVAAALVAVLAVTKVARRAPLVAVDPSVVAVVPFQITAADPALGYLSEGLVDLLATKMSGTMGVRPVDSRTLLSVWRESGSATDDVSARQALTVARRLGAGQVIAGEVAGTGSRVTLSATLRQAPSGRETARLSVAGSPDSLTSLIDRLAAQLLGRAAGEPEQRLPALAATPPAALRAYLDGWTLFRRRSRHAVGSFQTAIATDSSFALAALGAARAIFDGELLRGAPEAQLAWRLRDRLTPGDRAYLTAFLGPRYPEASTPQEYHDAVKRAVQLNPSNGDAWMWHAYWTCSLERGEPDMPARCRALTARALELDSLSTITTGLAVDHYQMLGDTADLRRALRLYVRLDSVSPISAFNQWSVATTLGDTAAARRLAVSDSMVSTNADRDLGPIYMMAGYFLREGRGLGDLEAALRRTQAIAPTDAQRTSLTSIQYRLALARGRATGFPEPPWWPEWEANYNRVVQALFADADPAPAMTAAAALERGLGSPPEYGCCLERFAVGQWALAAGRLSPARRAVADIRRFRDRGPEARTFELILEAQIAALEHGPDASVRLNQLDSALVNWQDYMDVSLLFGPLIAARLHEERQEYVAALSFIRRVEGGLEPVAVTYHRDQGRIAALAGDTVGAIRAYERYLRIRADAEPRLQPEVQRVRAELAALTRSR
jgi:eukaryotic-like serine/threonine-protein kinase